MDAREATDKWIEENNQDPWRLQDTNGVDLTLLRANLKLSPTERFYKHDAVRRFIQRNRRGRAAS
jgi:hypothetical protein